MLLAIQALPRRSSERSADFRVMPELLARPA